jgi:HK97 family phage prohead protease
MTVERRAAIELRAAGGKTPRFAGYAAVFDSPSQDLGGFTEIIRPGAFTRTLQSNTLDPLALVQHMPHLVLGRRGAGTLRLSQDSRGLAFEIDVPDTTTARDLVVSVERGDIRGASFAFSVPKGGDTWDVRGGQAIRELRDVDLHEITITPVPAYQDTSVAVRAFKARHSFLRPRLALRWLDTCA